MFFIDKCLSGQNATVSKNKPNREQMTFQLLCPLKSFTRHLQDILQMHPLVPARAPVSLCKRSIDFPTYLHLQTMKLYYQLTYLILASSGQ